MGGAEEKGGADLRVKWSEQAHIHTQKYIGGNRGCVQVTTARRAQDTKADTGREERAEWWTGGSGTEASVQSTFPQAVGPSILCRARPPGVLYF